MFGDYYYYLVIIITKYDETGRNREKQKGQGSDASENYIGNGDD